MKIMRPIKTLILLLIIVSGCTHYQNNDVLLEIGAYKLTVADYEMLKNEYKDRLTNEQLASKITEEGYILAYALENKYDTIGILSQKLTYAMRFYASKVDGYVWNRRVKPNLVVSFGDIKDAYHIRSAEYVLEIIHFPAQSLLHKFLSTDSEIESEKIFYALKKRVSSVKEVKLINLRSYYPFYPLGVYTNNIPTAKKGDAWGPFETLSGYYVVHIIDIKSIKQPDYESESPKIKKELLDGLTDKYIWESQKDILGKADPRMYDSAIAEMASKCIKEKREWPGIDKNLVLMDYKFQGKAHAYTANDFREFVNCEPMFFGSLLDADDVKGMLKSYLIDIYLYDEAKRMNIDVDKDYLSYKEQYQKKLFVEYFKTKVSEKIAPEQEFRKYYDDQKGNLKSFEKAVVTIFKFKDNRSASEGYGQIINQYNQKPVKASLTPVKIPGLLSVTEKEEISISDTSHRANFISTIANMSEGQVLPPMDMDDGAWVVCLSEKKGIAFLPYKYAKAGIERALLEKRLQDAMAELKAKYPLKVNHLKKYNQK